MTAVDARALTLNTAVQWTRTKNRKPFTCYGKVSYVSRRYFIVRWIEGDYLESTYWHTPGPDYAVLKRTTPPPSPKERKPPP